MKKLARIALPVLLGAALASRAARAADEPSAAPAHGEPAAHPGGEVRGHEGHGAGGHDEHGPKPINWVDFSNKEQPPYAALLINFAILAYVYVRFGKRPVAEGLKERRDAVAKAIEEAARLKEEAEERAEKYQSRLQNLSEELEEAKKALEKTAEAERAKILAEAADRAARLRRDAEFLIQQEGRSLRAQLTQETMDRVVRETTELLEKSMSAEDHQRLAEEFLRALEADGGRAEV
jgi:F-type H+-transporting ATPase subunit b